MVTTERFIAAMNQRWSSFDNTVTPDLSTVWGIMADRFNAAISDPLSTKWSILNPETGTGKTQGSYVYLSLLGTEALEVMSTGGEGVGAIFVARTRDQCAEAVQTINELAGKDVAITKHSDKTKPGGQTTLDEVFTHPILIVTHEAFVRSVERNTKGNFIGLWSTYQTWLGGTRSLTIVDESLTNVVEHLIISDNEIHALLSATPSWVKTKFLPEIGVLRDIENVIFNSHRPRLPGEKVMLAWAEGGYQLPEGLRWDEYEDEVCKALRMREVNATQTNTRISSIRETFHSVEGITTSWAYISQKKGMGQVLTSSRFRIPSDVPGPVILDATATQDIASVLLGPDRCATVAMPRSRSYANVTLHVARDGNGLGKTRMETHRTIRCKALGAFIRKNTEPDDRWLVVTHKGIEEKVAGYIPKDISAVAHWGKIDGRNDWKDYNNVIIFGLAYRDDVWAYNTTLSIKENVGEDDLTKAQSIPTKKKLENRALSADIIQAINRIRCRRVIDVNGNCPQADVWLILPDREHGDYILNAITTEMPQINVVPWEYKIDDGEAAAEMADTEIDYVEAAIAWSMSARPGDHAVSKIAHKLGLDAVTTKKFRKTIKNPQSALRTRLEALGITVRGNGIKGPKAESIVHIPCELVRAA